MPGRFDPGARRRPRQWTTPAGAFLFRHVRPRLLFGYEQRDVGDGQRAFIALPEKALLDLIYHQPAAGAAYLDALRLQNLDRLDPARLLSFAAQFDAPTRRAAEAIVRLAAQERDSYEPGRAEVLHYEPVLICVIIPPPAVPAGGALMADRHQLEQAIAVQESLRGTIDDAILDATLDALRRQLAALGPAAAEPRRVQATILFVDLAGHTDLIQGLDPEEIVEIIDRTLAQLAEPVARHGGRVVRFQGDGFKAVFGLPTAQENDPDRAVRAGLDIVARTAELAAELQAERGLTGLRARVGIDTGLVLVGEGAEGADSVTGLTVNLAARLENLAEPDSVLISHHTYQHVRGVFDVAPLPPVVARGFAEPVPTYRVLRPRPRTFRTRRRGVEGVATRMVGRDAELGRLQALLAEAAAGSLRAAVVVGDAGLGKSRLIYEFENWLDIQPVAVQLYRGRAWLETQHVPFSLLRDIFVSHCAIFDDDPPETVRRKVAADFYAQMGESEATTRKAHLVGHLLGYDFSDSPYVRPLLDSAQGLRQEATFYLTEYFRRAAGREPLLILVEDLHWADDSSLDTLATLAESLRDKPAMLLAAARPAFYERRPDWPPATLPIHRLDLALLDEPSARRLVDDILRRLDPIPDRLRDLIVGKAEGNPFYVEELIKMLIDDGVIVAGETVWRVAPERLAEVNVPPTLTGVLQARLESLPAAEREALQRAAVVGRLFWDAAVDYIGEDEGALPPGPWPALRRREIVFRREETAFEGVGEYIFKHALLHDVVYESVLRRRRRAYHHRAAEWLARTAGERADEYADLIAAHFARAEDAPAEAHWQTRAGQQAAARYAAAEALRAFGRALELTPPDDRATRYDLLSQRQTIYNLLADRAREAADLDEMERLANALDDATRRARVAVKRARFHLSTGVYERAAEAAEAAEALSRAAGDLSLQARALSYRGNATLYLGDYDAAQTMLLRANELAQAAGARRVEMETVRILGVIAEERGDFEGQARHFQAALDLARALGDRLQERRALNSLGIAVQNRGDYPLSLTYYEQSLAIAREIGDLVGEGTVLGNLGVQANNLGDYRRAQALFERGLQLARDADDLTGIYINLLNLAGIAAHQKDTDAALRLYDETQTYAAAAGDRSLQGYILNGRGRALMDGGRLDEAVALLRQARDLRLELGQPHMAVESRAFLAEALTAAGDMAAAMTEVEPALAFLEDGRLEDAEDLLRVLLAVYRALAAAGDARAPAVLARAHGLLQDAAAQLDEASQARYLADVTWNREIVRLWAEQSTA